MKSVVFHLENSNDEANSRSKTTDFTDFTYRSPHGPEEAIERARKAKAVAALANRGITTSTDFRDDFGKNRGAYLPGEGLWGQGAGKLGDQPHGATVVVSRFSCPMRR